MFDTLMDSRPAAPTRGVSRARGMLSSSGSLFLHAMILLSLVAGSYLHVEPKAEPAPRVNPEDLILRIQWKGAGVPAAAAPAPALGAADSSAKRVRETETTPRDAADVVQPQELPRQLPEAEASQGTDSAGAGAADGVLDGAPDGIPGGTVGGSPYGVIGGVPWGVPGGSALAGLPGGDEPIYIVGEVRAPVRSSYVKPEYPEVARKARVQGVVILEVVVGRTGDVEDIKVLRSEPIFDKAAIDAVRRWKYQPALQAGRPVKVYLTVRVEFGLV